MSGELVTTINIEHDIIWSSSLLCHSASACVSWGGNVSSLKSCLCMRLDLEVRQREDSYRRETNRGMAGKHSSSFCFGRYYA
eukprot:scaffold100264_cov69-Attheya_sp.AAC.3